MTWEHNINKLFSGVPILRRNDYIWVMSHNMILREDGMNILFLEYSFLRKVVYTIHETYHNIWMDYKLIIVGILILRKVVYAIRETCYNMIMEHILIIIGVFILWKVVHVIHKTYPIMRRVIYNKLYMEHLFYGRLFTQSIRHTLLWKDIWINYFWGIHFTEGCSYNL